MAYGSVAPSPSGLPTQPSMLPGVLVLFQLADGRWTPASTALFSLASTVSAAPLLRCSIARWGMPEKRRLAKIGKISLGNAGPPVGPPIDWRPSEPATAASVMQHIMRLEACPGTVRKASSYHGINTKSLHTVVGKSVSARNADHAAPASPNSIVITGSSEMELAALWPPSHTAPVYGGRTS